MPDDDAPQSFNLANHFLIAMPGMEDRFFSRSVVYVCEHGPKGALGLVVNKPGDVTLAELFGQLDLPLPDVDMGARQVYMGGPVQTERGFVLHDPVRAADLKADETAYSSTLIVPGGLEMTVSRDVLEAVSLGGGPRRLMVMLGYSAWDEGQLEAELADNSWLTVQAAPEVIFDAPAPQRYERALDLLGLQAWTIAPGTGHA